jgi:hypothetical protein
MKYKGSCHCQKVTYEVEMNLEGVELEKLPVQHYDGRSID